MVETTTHEPVSSTTEAPTTTAHKHSYSSKVTKKATCTKSGVKTFTCSCGDTYTEAIPPLGHDFKISDGLSVCSRCDIIGMDVSENQDGSILLNAVKDSDGMYDITVTAKDSSDTLVKGSEFLSGFSETEKAKIRSIKFVNKMYANPDSSNMFGGWLNSNDMFFGCEGLTSLDLSKLDTSFVTNMSSMFYDCKGLISLDLSNFNTSNVTNMGSMFYNCSNLAVIKASKKTWKISSSCDINGMFSECKAQKVTLQ